MPEISIQTDAPTALRGYVNTPPSRFQQQTDGQLVGDNTTAAIRANTLNADNGRQLPVAFSHDKVGFWTPDNPDIYSIQVANNLNYLRNYSKNDPEAKALAKELTQAWNCLSDQDKAKALSMIGMDIERGTFGLQGRPTKGADAHWLRMTLKPMRAAERNALLDHVPPARRDAINQVVFNKPNTTWVDTLFDYKTFLKANEYIGTPPENCHEKKIAIVGAGLAGSAAAYELNKIGNFNLTIIDAAGDVGGRLKATPSADGRVFFEDGGMRFPSTGGAFTHYLKHFDIKTDPDFPNPGTVPSKLYFDGEVIDWQVGNKAPDSPLFQKIGEDYKKFLDHMVGPFQEARAANDTAKLHTLWQGILEKYGDMSFIGGIKEGLREIGIEWTKKETDAFNALGIGTGGVGPWAPLSFTDEFRVIVNDLEVNQQLILEGSTSVVKKFYNEEVTRLDGSKATLQDSADIRLDTKVVGVSSDDGKPTLKMKNKEGETIEEQFDAVIMTPTHTAMEHIVGLTSGPQRVLAPEVASALSELHMASASKLFIQTETKFWEGKPHIPQVILTDGIPHMVYCLSYPGTTRGVVLVDYAWGDKSVKQLSMTPEERFEVIKEKLKAVSPEFVENLVPVDGEIHGIDWDTQNGAFRINYPGQDESQQQVFYDYLKVKHDPQNDSGVYIGGDSIGWNGGWAHSAVSSAINSTLSALERVGGKAAENSPLEMDPNLYKYSRN